MRSHFFRLLFLLLPCWAVGQADSSAENSYVKDSLVTVGLNLLTEEELKGTYYDCGIRIDLKASPDMRSFTRWEGSDEKDNKGRRQYALSKIELETGALIWTCDALFTSNRGHIWYYGDMMFYNADETTSRIDPQTGKLMWQYKGNFIYIDSLPGKPIGFSYPKASTAATYKDLHAIDLADGTFLWKRNIPWEHGWDYVRRINDTEIFICGGGLHRVDLTTGKGWSYNALATERVNFQDIPAGNAPEAPYALFYTGVNLIQGLTSNLVVEDEEIFYMSRGHMNCLDMQGKVRWKSALPKKTACYSNLYVAGGTVYLVGRGLAFNRNRVYNWGRPFMAAYSQSDGETEYFEIVDLRRAGNRVEDVDFYSDSILLVTRDRIVKSSMSDGKSGWERDFDVTRYGEIDRLVDAESYYRLNREKDCLENIVQSINARCYRTSKRKLVILDSRFNVEASFEADSLYSKCGGYDNLSLLRRDKVTALIDLNGEVSAVIYSDSEPVFVGESIYIPVAKGVIKVHAEEIIRDRYRMTPADEYGPISELPRRKETLVHLTANN